MTGQLISLLRGYWTADGTLAYSRGAIIASARVRPDGDAWTWWIRVVPEAAASSSAVLADVGVEASYMGALQAAEWALHPLVMGASRRKSATAPAGAERLCP